MGTENLVLSHRLQLEGALLRQLKHNLKICVFKVLKVETENLVLSHRLQLESALLRQLKHETMFKHSGHRRPKMGFNHPLDFKIGVFGVSSSSL